jgi:dihydroneopterin aldolase
MDTLFLRDMTVFAIVGVNPEERVNRQPVVLNVELSCDLSASCRSDRLEDTINYKSLQDRILKEVESSSFFLIERLAQRVAELCLEDPRVQETVVTLDKPEALRATRSAAVRLVRKR